VERAKQALARAEKRLASTDQEVDWDRAVVALQRALVRIKVGELHRRVHSHSSQ
jgi:F0F1-type ATP synthase epsilon subunit